MNGKRIIVCVLMTLLSVKIFPQSMTLDEAIRTTATELGQRINSNRIPGINFSNQSIEQTAAEIRQQLTVQHKIAVLSFSSSWRDLSAYIIDELNNAIVRNGSLTVVDRQQLDLVRQEQNFQMSEEVSDASAQSIGQFLGAQSVLSGSFTKIGEINRFRIRVIAVETGVVQYSNSINIKNDAILTALMPKAQPAPRPQKQKPEIFDDYTFFNGLTIFGYTYSFDTPLGFSFGVFGVYTSLGFAVPNWDGYGKSYSSDLNRYNDLSNSRKDQRYQIIDWVMGYNVTIIPNILYLPIGVGTEAVKEWRLRHYSGGGSIGNGSSYSSSTQWYPAPQWETSFMFEAGLLFRVKTPVNFAPYLFGTYRNIGIIKHSFSIGGGGSFDFLANK
jgi:TolB-like protein